MRTDRASVLVSLWATAVIVVACGSGGTSGSGTNGGPGTADAGSANPAGCPSSAPADGASCADGLSCNYDCGGTEASCVSGRWSVSVGVQGCPSGTPTSCPAPAPLSNEGLGGPCSGAANECEAGLACEIGYREGSTVTSSNLCTVRCDETGVCPSGSVCEDAETSTMTDAGLRILKLCFPECATDADCQKDKRAGQCTPRDGGAKVCTPLSCNSADECPTGYECVGRGCPGPNDESPASPGWCEKR